MYCEKCKLYFEEKGRCPVCNNKKVRDVRDDDICEAAEINMILAGLLEEVYKQNNIPYMMKGRLGAALTLTLGAGIETIRFYVPYICLDRAKELADDIFNSEVIDDLDNCPDNDQDEEYDRSGYSDEDDD